MFVQMFAQSAVQYVACCRYLWNKAASYCVEVEMFSIITRQYVMYIVYSVFTVMLDEVHVLTYYSQ